MYAELASMRASSCFGIVNLWQGQIPKQLLSNIKPLVSNLESSQNYNIKFKRSCLGIWPCQRLTIPKQLLALIGANSAYTFINIMLDILQS